MASRKEQKEQARARRLAEEQARAESNRRTRRVRMLVGVIVGAVAVVAVLIAVSLSNNSSGGIIKNKKKQSQLVTQIQTLLAGIPQNGNTLGNPNAKVIVTEFGDLECPICRDFALGAENQLIANDVRAGKVKLVYRSLETATGNGPNASVWGTQQAGALAAGLQNLEWYYIELFYHQQGAEGSGYAVPSYFDSLAQQVPGLNYTKWLTSSQSQSLLAEVTSDEQIATTRGYNATPTIAIQGPKGTAQPIVGDTDYGSLESAIKSVS